MARRSESFPTILRSKPRPPFQKNIILVHGFRSTTPEEFDYQTALESCVKDVVARAEDGSYQVRPFRFHACDMLAGGEDTFRETKLKLVSKLLKLQSQFADFGESASDNQSSAAAPSSSFIFVAHGVGSLLVKSVLEMDAGRAIARNSLGLIFLDSPRECTQIQDSGEYLAAVNRPREKFSINRGGKERSPSSTPASSLIQAADTSPQYLGGHLQPTFINVGWPDSSPEIPRPIKHHQLPVLVFALVRLKRRARRHNNILDRATLEQQLEDILKRPIPPSKHSVEALPEPLDSTHDPRVRGHLQSGAPIQPTPESQRRANAKLVPLPIPPPTPRSSRVGLHQGPLPAPEDKCTGPMHRENWKLSADEGRSFLERGQLKNAIAAFDEARKHLVTKTEEPHHNISLVEIEMRIAMIAQYRGDATQAETLLRDVTERESRINQSSMSVQDAKTWGGIMKELHRWLAASLISQGRISEAIRELQGVVGSTPECWNDVTSFKAKRDLAVAYGLRGTVTEAQRIIHMLDAICEEHKDRRRSLPVGGPARQSNGGSSHVLLHRKTQSEPSAPGFTSRPDEVDSAFSSATDEELLRLEGKHNTLKLAGAVVDNLAGNYVKALDHATEVLAILKRHRGGWHIKTLEAASLRTWLLARTSRLREAEEECMQTRQTLTREFGAGHPKTLEMTGILVFIFRKQRRLVEAVDTCTSLCQMAEMAPTLEHHPLILAHKAELARCHRAAGQYQAAERLLRDVIQQSKHLQSSQHEREVDTPDGLLFEAELARVSCASGNLEDAQRCALGVLRRQRKLFASAAANTDLQSRDDAKTGAEPATIGEKPNSALIDEVLDDITFELALDEKIRRWDVGHSGSKASLPASRLLGAETLAVSTALQDRIDGIDAQIAQFFSDRGMADLDLALLEGQPSRRRELAAQLRCKLSVLTLHPSIFYTLRLLASIQWQLELEDANITQPRRMLALVWRWQANPDVLGPDDPSTLTTEYEYAVVRRELGHNDTARRCFRRVFVTRARVLGESHPDTLSAKRELVVTSCLMTRWRHPDAYLDSAAPAADPKPLETDGYVSDADGPCATSGNATEIDMGIDQWDDAELCSRDIFRLHQFHLGKEHPETLKSLLWVFSIQLLLKKDDSVHETCALLLAILQSPKVTKARLVDALQMQERIAQLYLDLDYPQQSANVLRGIVEALPSDSEGSEPSGLTALKGRVSELQKELQQRDPRLHNVFAHISNSKVSR